MCNIRLEVAFGMYDSDCGGTCSHGLWPAVYSFKYGEGSLQLFQQILKRLFVTFILQESNKIDARSFGGIYLPYFALSFGGNGYLSFWKNEDLGKSEE